MVVVLPATEVPPPLPPLPPLLLTPVCIATEAEGMLLGKVWTRASVAKKFVVVAELEVPVTSPPPSTATVEDCPLLTITLIDKVLVAVEDAGKVLTSAKVALIIDALEVVVVEVKVPESVVVEDIGMEMEMVTVLVKKIVTGS